MTAETAHPPDRSAMGIPRTVLLQSCPVCGNGTTAFSFASVDLLHGVSGLFRYDNCLSCDSFYQNPRAVDDDLTAYYPDDYFTHEGTPAGSAGGSSGRVRELVRRLVVDSYTPPRRGMVDLRRSCGRMLRAIGFLRRRAMFGLIDELSPPTTVDRCLEIGPGTGDDMWRLSQLGWMVTGIDLDPHAADVAMSRSGCRVVVGPVLDHRPAEPYGLVYGSHSIEHVPALRLTLIHVRSLLAPEGRLVLIVPNARSLSSRLYGPLSVVWDPPRHLALPSVRALEELLGEAGFHRVSVKTAARRAGHYCAIARARRRGITGTAAWDTRGTLTERLLHGMESFLVRLGFHVGEEIIVAATAK